MITKLLTGSRLLLAETEQSTDIDYKIIIDNQEALLELDPEFCKENDLFIIDILKLSGKRLNPSEKENVFYLLITWLLHKKLNIEIENESLIEPFINEMMPQLKTLLTSVIGLSAEIRRKKWAWWIILAIKYLHNEWETLTINEIQQIFQRARSNSLTESELNLIDDFIVEEILQKEEIMRVRGMLTPRQLEKIAFYNERHETR